MQKILIASNNSHKISEIKSVLYHSNLKLLSLKDFGIAVDVVEDGNTLKENAFKKAKEVYNILGIPALSDDTGLFVEVLNGEPGVYSARYAGEDATYEDNRNKLLGRLNSISDEKKNARFESVICFHVNEKEFYFFEGICEGTIIKEVRGTNGFGYDPVFLPKGFNKTFAELSDKEKNEISHRAIALQKFSKFYKSYNILIKAKEQ